MSIEEINLGLIARLKEQAGIHSAGCQRMYWMQLQMPFRSMKICRFTPAEQQTFSDIRSLADKQSAQEIISAFEEKQQLTESRYTDTYHSEENTGIQVYIGDETPVQTMKDCSVVTATYELGEGMKGNDRYYRTEANGL